MVGAATTKDRMRRRRMDEREKDELNGRRRIVEEYLMPCICLH